MEVDEAFFYFRFLGWRDHLDLKGASEPPIDSVRAQMNIHHVHWEPLSIIANLTAFQVEKSLEAVFLKIKSEERHESDGFTSLHYKFVLILHSRVRDGVPLVLNRPV